MTRNNVNLWFVAYTWEDTHAGRYEQHMRIWMKRLCFIGDALAFMNGNFFVMFFLWSFFWCQHLVFLKVSQYEKCTHTYYIRSFIRMYVNAYECREKLKQMYLYRSTLLIYITGSNIYIYWNWIDSNWIHRLLLLMKDVRKD